jgi:chromosome partitioning protein
VSMLDRRKRLQRELAASLAAQRADLLATVVPSTSAIERMGVERAPVQAFAPSTLAAAAFRDLWGEVAERLWP